MNNTSILLAFFTQSGKVGKLLSVFFPVQHAALNFSNFFTFFSRFFALTLFCVQVEALHTALRHANFLVFQLFQLLHFLAN